MRCWARWLRGGGLEGMGMWRGGRRCRRCIWIVRPARCRRWAVRRIMPGRRCRCRCRICNIRGKPPGMMMVRFRQGIIRCMRRRRRLYFLRLLIRLLRPYRLGIPRSRIYRLRNMNSTKRRRSGIKFHNLGFMRKTTSVTKAADRRLSRWRLLS